MGIGGSAEVAEVQGRALEVGAGRAGAVPRWVAASMPLLLRLLVLWLATRVVFVLLAYLGYKLHLFQPTGQLGGGLILSWQRWDVNWYLIISRLGYPTRQSANFFPLFPALMGGISWLLGDGGGPVFPQPDKLRVLVGMGISNVALLVGLYAVARLAQLDAEPEDERAGVRAAWILLAYPFAVAWMAPYSEGLFLAFTALALLFARRGRWYWVGLVGLLAGLTRPTAVILILPIAWEYGRQHGWWQRLPRPSGEFARQLAKGAVAIGSVPAGIGLYFAYLYIRFGDILLPLHTQLQYWHHVAMPPWSTLQLAVRNLRTIPDSGLLSTDLTLLAGVTLVVVAGIRRLPVAYLLYMAGLLYLVTAAPVTVIPDVLTGVTRYMDAAIPVFLVLSWWAARRPLLEMALVSGGMILQGAMTIAFFQGSPVA
ncbi:MAG: hypothetical protein J2P57_03410 [Acidimicrobiaceae bacterium]|nr:hypothetical protein [Acidimicrobiaceae bacterium]